MITKSKNYSDLLKTVIPGGANTLSKQADRYPANYPTMLKDGAGGTVRDVDGKEYVDLMAGLGCISVGYYNRIVNRKVIEQLDKGISFSLPSEVEYEAAKKLTELVPGTEMWKFGKTGTDGVLMAIRAARAYTGRKKILISGFHGCSDHFECLGTRNAGMIDMSEYTNKYQETLSDKDSQYAALVLEPWILECEIWPTVREWCTKTGTLLIADEVVTGGRFEGFTASSYIKIEPDLYVLGKGIANGFPLCAVGGTRRIMSTFERDDFFASGTFNGEAISLASFMATQEILVQKIDEMIKHGSFIQTYFNHIFEGLGVCLGYPTRLQFDFKDTMNKWVFMQEMCKNGVLIGYNNFIMADHSDNDVNTIREAMNNACHAIKSGVKLEGRSPISAVKH